MSIKPLITHEELLRKFEKDPEFRKESRKQRPYYDILLAIIHRRSDLGMTQKELAEKANTHQSRISRIETAEHDIRLSTLIEIAEALGTEVRIQLAPISEPPAEG